MIIPSKKETVQRIGSPFGETGEDTGGDTDEDRLPYKSSILSLVSIVEYTN